MKFTKIEREFWPTDIAHATMDATAVWRGKTRGREFWIFRQPSYTYLVRERGSFGWLAIDAFTETLSAAQRAAEQEARS